MHTQPQGRDAAGKKVKPKPFQPQALFWRRADLRKQLATPLATTMAVKAPKQDGSIYLVLDRPS